MKSLLVAAVVLGLACPAGLAQRQRGFQFLERTEAEQISALAAEFTESSSGIWTWTDQIAYQAGAPVTVRWTVKPNNDLYPYTLIAYRQNNQTGAKTYFPNNTTTPTDYFGNTIAQGFRITRLPEATKAILSGGSLNAPNEPGMHTIVIQLRDYTGNRVVKAAYWKFGVYSEVQNVSGNISANTTWTNDKLYRISGIVSVLNNATLTINPGTIVQGTPGSTPPSALLVTTAGKLSAVGTRSRPILMTSTQPVGSRNRGDWGGLILLGKARINDPSGSLGIEGLPDIPEARYGGTDDAHNCGSLKYVRVEFAGSLLRANEETNAFTWGACGTQTQSEFLQAHYGLDDSFEWFGGINDLKYAVGTYGADDYHDAQIGYRGRTQFFLAVANDDLSNRGLEWDNYERGFTATPLGKALLYNATFVGGGTRGYDEADSPCMFPRRGAGGFVGNTICYNWISRTLGGADFDSLQPNITSGDFNMNGILLWNNGLNATPPRANTIADQVVTQLQPFAQDAARQFVIADPMLRNPLERNSPDFRPLSGSPAWRASWVAPPDDGFFDQSVTFAGAFGDLDWTEEWATFAQEQDLKP